MGHYSPMPEQETEKPFKSLSFIQARRNIYHATYHQATALSYQGKSHLTKAMCIFNFSTLLLVVLLLVVGQQQVYAALRFKKPSSARALQDEGEESGRRGGRHLGKGGKGKGGSSSTTCPSKFSKMTKMTNKTTTMTTTPSTPSSMTSSNTTSRSGSSDDELGWCEDFGICECSPLPEEERCDFYEECFAQGCVRSNECLDAARYICPEDPASLCNDQIVDEFCMLFVTMGDDGCLEDCKNYVSTCCKPDFCPECVTDDECDSTQECVDGVCKTKRCTDDTDCDCPDGRGVPATCETVCAGGTCVPFTPGGEGCNFDGTCDPGEDQVTCPSDCCDCEDPSSWDPEGGCFALCINCDDPQDKCCFPYDKVRAGNNQDCIANGQSGGLSFLELCAEFKDWEQDTSQGFCSGTLGIKGNCKNPCGKHHLFCCRSCDGPFDCDADFDCCTNLVALGIDPDRVDGAGVCVPDAPGCD